MVENAKNEAAPKKSKWKSLKAEFSKIVWPTKKTLKKETIAVIVYTAILGLVITGIDFVFQFGVDKLLSLSWK